MKTLSALLFALLFSVPALADPAAVAGTWLSRDGDGAWSGGFIYDPNSGKTYRCKLKLKDRNTLKLRGYIGISLLGRTDVWTRQEP
jgi:uncharacterized protein (DUF2147 family)